MFKKVFNPRTSSRPKTQTLIVVSGLPRSGTSMMMKMLAEGGLPVLTDSIRTADEDNPNGYFELEVVKQLSEGQKDWLAGADGKIVKVIARAPAARAPLQGALHGETDPRDPGIAAEDAGPPQ
jgi:hypothetical protein